MDTAAPEAKLPRVLIVDDEPSVATVLTYVVIDAGAEAVVAGSVAAAKALLEMEQFACALVDKNLPDGTGFDVLAEMKRRDHRTLALIVTGYANIDSAVEALRAGAVDYLIKPVDVASTTRRVATMLQHRRLIDENERMQQVIAHNDRLTSLGTLAAGVAHEINNPLAYVMANLEYLQSGLTGLAPPTPEQIVDLRQVVEETLHGADRVKRIVADLKLFSRADRGELEAVNVKSAIESGASISWNQIRARAQLVKELGESPPVSGSSLRLVQVFVNLLVNASQAFPADRPTDQNQIRVRLGTAPDGMVVIEVSDNGMGIGPDVVTKIFDPFFTTKPIGVGTGLGLSVCAGIVQEMGGSLSVESEVGKGTRFIVRLPPRAQTGSFFVAPKLPSEPLALRGAKVLVVDDEPLIASAIRRLLVPDHEVLTVEGGAEALALIRTDVRFDVIISDLFMPGLDGLQFYNALKQLSPEQAEKLVFATGATDTSQLRLDAALTRRPIIDKPFSRRAMQVVIAQLA